MSSRRTLHLTHYPPALGQNTSSVRQYKRYCGRRDIDARSRRLKRKQGLTARRHALRVSPIKRPHESSKSLSMINDKNTNGGHNTERSRSHSKDKNTNDGHNAERSRNYSEARAKLFSMKRRIVDRLLQKKASETGNRERQDGRLLILAYKDIDVDGSGSVDFSEFSHSLSELNVGLNSTELGELFTALDTDGSGDLSLQEFLESLMVADKPPSELMIDRGRRLTMDTLERKINTFEESRKAKSPHSTSSLIERTPRILNYHSAAPSLVRRQRQKILASARWQHPLDTQRPSTTSSEYGWHRHEDSQIPKSFGSESENTGDTRVVTTTQGFFTNPGAQSLSNRQSSSMSCLQSTMTSRKPASRASTAMGSVRSLDKSLSQLASRDLDTEGDQFLRSRSTGKSYQHSPKFAENRRTWERIGYGERGDRATLYDLHQSETQRRTQLKRAPAFPSLENSYGDVYAHAKNFRRPEKGVSSNPRIGGQSNWESSKGFVPRQTKIGRLQMGQQRVERLLTGAMNTKDLVEVERVMAKTKQRLRYLRGHMQSQQYLNRQRGIGVGKGLLKSGITRRHRGGHQVAKLVRGNTPWLGE